MSQGRLLLESLSFAPLTGSGKRVDRDAGVIYGVKLLGWESGNGRRYEPEAVKAALALYEGAPAHTDHPQQAGQLRSVLTSFGQYFGVRAEPDGVYGNLRLNKAHAFSPVIMEAAENLPGQYKLSHNVAYTSRFQADGLEVVNSIQKVFSVDVVDRAATTNTLFESLDPQRSQPVAKRKIKLVVESLLPKFDAAKQARVKKLAEAMGAYGEGEMEGPADAASPDDSMMLAFEQAVMACFRDASMDQKGKLTKIKEILKAQEACMGKESEPEPEKKPEGDAKKEPEKDKKDTESLRELHGTVKTLQEQLDAYKVRDALAAKSAAAVKLCDEARLPPDARTPVFMEQLTAAPDEAGIKRLVEDRRALVRGSAGVGPTSAASAHQPGGGPGAGTGHAPGVDDFLKEVNSAYRR